MQSRLQSSHAGALGRQNARRDWVYLDFLVLFDQGKRTTRRVKSPLELIRNKRSIDKSFLLQLKRNNLTYGMPKHVLHDKSHKKQQFSFNDDGAFC
ncbi:MAG: hypothetical protein EOP44_01710 [Sphingobacteriaceae bacterium]|nr:MAG: hypothetical protein EOP44_01710 [Sphingobacteriaceae bacterium]